MKKAQSPGSYTATVARSIRYKRKKSKTTQQKQMLKLICEECGYTMHKI
ncbi:MAG: hypothetical protein QXU12_03975 [Nitrososphaerota archaeon]